MTRLSNWNSSSNRSIRELSRQLEELVLGLDCFILARMSVIVILELGCAERKTTESINILYLIFRSLLFCDVSIVVLLHDSSFPPLI
jgi:hypothetical protein